MKEFRVDRSMMGRQAPETYRTTKRGQTAIPEEPPREIGRLLVGRKTRPRREICGGAEADEDFVRPLDAEDKAKCQHRVVPGDVEGLD